jgi:hypothetical protein
LTPETLALTAGLAGVFVGLAIGLMMARGSSGGGQDRALEEKLAASEQALADYKDKVNEHFEETARKVNNLTDSYREVYQHLATSSMELTSGDVSQRLLDAGSTAFSADEQTESPEEKTVADAAPAEDTDTPDADSDAEQPRDWAPRKQGDKGQLSEDYGLTDTNSDAEAAEAEPSRPARESSTS